MRRPFRSFLSLYLGVFALAAFHLGAGTAIAQPPPFLLSFGVQGSDPGQFQNPHGVALDVDGNVYVADSGNNRVQKFTASGGYLGQWGSQGSGVGQFNNPQGVLVDPSGRVFVADTDNHRIQVFTVTGAPLYQWGTYGTGSGQFAYPRDIARNEDGVFIADYGNDRVQRFSDAGVFIAQWGSHGSGDGQFDGPSTLETNQYGMVYVGDNNRVQRFTTLGGSFLAHYCSGTTAGIAIDMNQARVYRSLTTSNKVRQTEVQFCNSWGELLGFNQPSGLAVRGSTGTLYVSDSMNHRIMVYGDGATIANTASWGRIKTLYR